MTDVLELEIRRKLHDLVKHNPGVNISTLAKMLQISTQLVDYHIQYLQHYDLVSIEKREGFKRCYLKGKIGIEDKRLMSVLNQEIPLQIVLYLLKHPYSRHRDMLQHLAMSSPRFSYHLKKLVKNNIIEIIDSGEKKGYTVTNAKVVMGLLIRYRPLGMEEMIEDTWLDFGPC